MRAYRFPHIGLLIAQAPGEPGALDEEFYLLDHPAGAVRVMSLFGRDASVGKAAAGGDCHGFARDAPRANQIADFWTRLAGIKGAFQVLSPERFGSSAGEKLHEVGGILIGTKLIVGCPVFR